MVVSFRYYGCVLGQAYGGYAGGNDGLAGFDARENLDRCAVGAADGNGNLDETVCMYLTVDKVSSLLFGQGGTWYGEDSRTFAGVYVCRECRAWSEAFGA